jgi:D-arabinonate dehydratase
MKIIDVKSTLLYKPFNEGIYDAARLIKGRDVLIIEIITDEDKIGIGFLTGLGVAYGSEMPIIKTIVDLALKPTIVGEDPTNIERLWQKMYSQTTRFGRKGAAIRAISGIDIALWDMLGKVANLPVYKLLGGYSDKVKLYASGGFYSNNKNDLASLSKEMESYVAQGFTAVKMKVGKNPSKDIERVKVVRQTIGENIDLLVDANEAWDYNTALKFIRGIEKFNIYWIEEPVAPDDIEGYINLTAKSPIPIAAGENEYTKYGFKDLINNKAVNVVQPDVTRVGGISEWLKVATYAKAYNMPCVTHAVQEIHLSLVAAVSNAPMMEYFTKDHYLQTFISELFIEPASLNKIDKGYVDAPKVPGLGLEIDYEVLEHFTV